MKPKLIKCLFIGDRCNVLDALKLFPLLVVSDVFVLKDSYLYRNRKAIKSPYHVFSLKDRKKVVNLLMNSDFDILISNGCPFILPISALSNQQRIFLNIHPGILPRFKGLHPVNEALLTSCSWAGATMHVMTDELDQGNIIEQQRLRLTPDIDLGLLYNLIFDMEKEVFIAGMKKMIKSRFSYKGRKQGKVQCVPYQRRLLDMQVDFKKMTSVEILTRIKAFGISSQGVLGNINGRTLRIFQAEMVKSAFVLNKYKNTTKGSLILFYDNKMLIKVCDGIIKVISYQWINQ